MKEIKFNRNDYKSYKDFYCDAYEKLDGRRFDDFDYCQVPLGHSADTLEEFLWYCNKDNNKYIFVNFDKEKIAQQKNFDDYKYNIIIEVFEDFVKDYPNNKLEFRMEDEKNNL